MKNLDGCEGCQPYSTSFQGDLPNSSPVTCFKRYRTNVSEVATYMYPPWRLMCYVNRLIFQIIPAV